MSLMGPPFQTVKEPMLVFLEVKNLVPLILLYSRISSLINGLDLHLYSPFQSNDS